jgi:hypothetical protein
MKAITCVWGRSATADAERIRRYCTAAGWELVAEASKTGIQDGTLGWMLRALECTGAEAVILAEDDLRSLERELPRLWPRVREVLDEAAIAVLSV